MVCAIEHVFSGLLVDKNMFIEGPALVNRIHEAIFLDHDFCESFLSLFGEEYDLPQKDKVEI